MNSNFHKDLTNEQKFSEFLHKKYYPTLLKNYKFTKVDDLEKQFKGIDLEIFDKDDNLSKIDEKAQLSYVDKSLPTFAFELSYLNRAGKWREGWLFDESKETTHYFLATHIRTDNQDNFTSCRLVSVNRQKLIDFLKERGLTKQKVSEYEKSVRSSRIYKRSEMLELDSQIEGNIYFTNWLLEQPINLVLKLDFLISLGIGKELIPIS